MNQLNGSRVVTSTAQSPPHDPAAFRRFLNEERTWGAVFTIRPDGSGERQITKPPQGFVDRNPDISPDGRRMCQVPASR